MDALQEFVSWAIATVAAAAAAALLVRAVFGKRDPPK